jgi:hypothetical protein
MACQELPLPLAPGLFCSHAEIMVSGCVAFAAITMERRAQETLKERIQQGELE